MTDHGGIWLHSKTQRFWMDTVNGDKLFVLRMSSAVISMFSNVFCYIVLGSSISQIRGPMGRFISRGY